MEHQARRAGHRQKGESVTACEVLIEDAENGWIVHITTFREVHYTHTHEHDEDCEAGLGDATDEPVVLRTIRAFVFSDHVELIKFIAERTKRLTPEQAT